MLSKKTTKNDEIFTIDLTLCSKCQIDGEDFINFCGLLGKHELYRIDRMSSTMQEMSYVLLKCIKVHLDSPKGIKCESAMDSEEVGNPHIHNQ